MVLSLPARLSRPASIRRADEPVTRTRTVFVSTRFFSSGAQESKFWTSSRSRKAGSSSRAASLNVRPKIRSSNHHAKDWTGISSLPSSLISSNWTLRILRGATFSSWTKCSMIWSCSVDLPTWRGPRKTVMGASPFRRLLSNFAKAHRLNLGRVFPGFPSHQGFIRRTSSSSAGGKRRLSKTSLSVRVKSGKAHLRSPRSRAVDDREAARRVGGRNTPLPICAHPPALPRCHEHFSAVQPTSPVRSTPS